MGVSAKTRMTQRTRVVVGVFAFALLAVALRAGALQLLPNEKLERLSRQQSQREVQIPASRGDVLDRHGKLLAGSVDVFSIYADPRKIDPNEARALANRLSTLLAEPFHVLYQRLVSDRAFVWLARQRSPEIRDRVRALNLPGIGVRREPRRYYPERELASHVLGFTNLDGRGLEGIERRFQSVLAGTPKEVSVMRDALGRYLLFEPDANDVIMKGQNVSLTLDSTIQHAAEDALQNTMKRFNAKAAMAVVLRVEDAGVLAMAVEPHFNPNDAGAFDASVRRNRAVTDMFEPGSTLKPLVIARALDTGAVAEDAIIFCENGKLEVSGYTIRDGKGYGWLSLAKIIEKSSNIGAARIGQALGRERLGALLADLGFGQRTGIRLPGETSGIVRPSRSWSEVGLVNISFGHGVALSAIQLAAAYRSLAAGGMYLAPRIVATDDPQPERRVFSRGAAAKVTRMMVKATGAEGTGTLASIDGYRVAGKTGTAQKIDPVSGGYSREAHVAVFAGFVPADNPAAVIVVAVDEPKPVYSGGQVAAPLFAAIARATMSELSQVPDDSLFAPASTPDVAPEVAVGALPNQQDVSLVAALAATRGGTPSFVGMTAREALDAYVRRNMTATLEIEGSGVVATQTPRPGAALKGPLRLSLSSDAMR